jgi:hypothetical protein
MARIEREAMRDPIVNLNSHRSQEDADMVRFREFSPIVDAIVNLQSFSNDQMDELLAFIDAWMREAMPTYAIVAAKIDEGEYDLDNMDLTPEQRNALKPEKEER